jgi:Fe-Mn family superoxide dismutase
MAFELPKLPFEPEALAPWMSTETFSYHHGKHHAAYVKKLNELIDGTEHAEQSLEDIVRATTHTPAIFNNAGQHFNHTMFWESLSPEKQEPSIEMIAALKQDFGSFEGFVEEFTTKAATLFGSGWVFLTIDSNDGKLEVGQYANALNPLPAELTPLLNLDVWEHSYYIDHRNDRGAYINGFWEHVNWKAVEARLPL